MKDSFNDLKQLAEFALTYDGESQEFECDIVLTEDSEEFRAYAVSVCNKDLLFYCVTATINYLIDVYGTMPLLTLYSIER